MIDFYWKTLIVLIKFLTSSYNLQLFSFRFVFSSFISLIEFRTSLNCLLNTSNRLLIKFIESVKLDNVSFKQIKNTSSCIVLVLLTVIVQYHLSLFYLFSFRKLASLVLAYEKCKYSLHFTHCISSLSKMSSLQTEYIILKYTLNYVTDKRAILSTRPYIMNTH